MLKYRLFQLASAITAISFGITLCYMARVVWDAIGSGRYFVSAFFIAIFIALLMFAYDWHKKPERIKPKV